MTPLHMHLGWFNAWREHVRNAKTNTQVQDGYCRAAMLAQMQYVTYQAQYFGEVREWTDTERRSEK